MRAFFGRSIAFRLITAVLAVEAVSALLVILLSFGYERHAHLTAFGVMVHGRAMSVLGAVQDSERADDTLILSRDDLRLPDEDVWEALDQDGRVLGSSANWPSSFSGAEFTAPRRSKDDSVRLTYNGRPYRLIVLRGTRDVDPDAPGGGKIHQVTIYYGSPVDRVWHAIQHSVEFYASGSLLLLLVTGPLIAWLLHRGLLPLRQLAQRASLVSVSAWEFSAPPHALATPELAPLAIALERVLDRLKKAFDQQRVFVSDAAHELKTAVAVIKSSLQLLNLRPRTAEEYRVGLQRCVADAERLEELVGQMLMLARVESAESVPVTPPSTPVSKIIDRVIEHLSTYAELRGLSVVFGNHLQTECFVGLDPEDCFTLFSNLLLNALQHSPSGSRVEVTLDAGTGLVRASVSDSGEGIDEAILPHLFERFYRGDPSRNRATGGAGLGLAICKAIVDRAGGSIEIANQPDAGATVTVCLPLAK